MENNNGRGVFYGVIGVATLIVAIIGATFAYFAAQTNTAPNAIRAEAAIIQLEIEDHDETDIRGDMIPVEVDGTTENQTPGQAELAAEYSGLFPRFPAAGAEATGDADRVACQDLLGNNICSIYSFTITNPSTAAQQIYGFLTVESNTFGNLRYAVFKGTPSEVSAHADKWKVLGTNPTADGNGNYNVAAGGLVKRMAKVPTTTTEQASFGDTSATTETNDRYIPGMTVTLQPNDTVTYTVLLWIEEMGTDQTSTDSGDGTTAKAFSGGIFINTSGGGTGITATLKLAESEIGAE